MRLKNKFVSFSFVNVEDPSSREVLTKLISTLLENKSLFYECLFTERMDFLLYDQNSSCDLDKFEVNKINVFVGTLMSEEAERSLYVDGFHDILSLDLVTQRGFNRMVTSNYFKKINESKNKAIQEHINQVARLNSLGLMAGGIAHELNNPLTALKGYAYKLKKSPTGDHKIADKINSIANRMAKVVDGIRSFSRDGSCDESECINPFNILQYVSDFMDVILEKQGTKLIIKNELPEDFRCWLSRSKMEGMFQNFISNSADAIENAFGEITVLLYQVDEDNYSIKITDNGAGMSNEVIQRIFEPFYTTKEVGKGTGLGMGMILESVNIHKGTINVSSEIGVGTTFLLCFPVNRRPDQTKLEIDKIQSTESGPIAIIDDDLAIGDILCEVFKDDYEVAYYQSSIDFIESDFSSYSLILTDLNMPLADGFDVARAVKKGNPEIPIWLMSTDQKIDKMDGDKSLPFDNIIRKPIVDFENLKKEIELLFRN